MPAPCCTALIEDREYSPLRPLVERRDYSGYALVTKPAREFTEERVAREWCQNGWMRARVRWRVKISTELLNGGYRAMAAGA